MAFRGFGAGGFRASIVLLSFQVAAILPLLARADERTKSCARAFAALAEREAAQAAEAPDSPSRLKKIAADFGFGKIRAIRDEIREIKNFSAAQAGKFSALSDQVPNLKPRVERFVQEASIERDPSGYHVIPSDKLDDYLAVAGRDTIELLYVPGASVPHLPKPVSHVGHIAVRVGDRVYHQTGGSGFRVETLDSFLNTTKKDRKVYGTVLQVSPREAGFMRSFFTAMAQRQVPYSFLLNNCSQAACRAMALAGVERLPSVAAFDPLATRMLARRSERVAGMNLYNADKDLTPGKLARATVTNRLVFYGLPVGFATGVTYGGIEAVDILIHYLSELDMDSVVAPPK